MTKSDQIILQLLRKTLNPDCTIDESLFQEVDWAEVIDCSFDYGVGAITFDGVELLGESCRPEIENLIQWFGQTAYQESDYNKSWEVAQKLSSLWEAAGIKAVVLKGHSLAQYYPKPNHRYSCDLDVFIPSGWEKACESLESQGIQLEREVYKEVEFTLNDVYVECHRYIIPIRGNKYLVKVERYLRSLLEVEQDYFEGTPLLCPPLMFTTILYIEHALGDLLHGNFTLKHVVDWLVLRKQDIQWETFNSRCREFGFEKFYHLVEALADVVEGKKEVDDLPVSYRKVFEGLFNRKQQSAYGLSWFQRRVNLFWNIIRNRRYYVDFGYCSMPEFLAGTVWAHFFKKEVDI